jgi:hypothetical protein
MTNDQFTVNEMITEAILKNLPMPSLVEQSNVLMCLSLLGLYTKWLISATTMALLQLFCVLK